MSVYTGRTEYTEEMDPLQYLVRAKEWLGMAKFLWLWETEA